MNISHISLSSKYEFCSSFFCGRFSRFSPHFDYSVLVRVFATCSVLSGY